uniref:Uncharacterized protein n=1 Tax=Leersia perrieri TaxID=77586 RepID=A0A0D9XNX8_9ORYZ
MQPKMDGPLVSMATSPPHAPLGCLAAEASTAVQRRAVHQRTAPRPRNGRRGEGMRAAPHPSCRRFIHGRAEDVLQRAGARARRHRPRRRVHRHRTLQAPPRPQHPHRRKEPGERSIFGI